MVLFPGRNRLYFNPEEHWHKESFLLLLHALCQGPPRAQGAAAARDAKADVPGPRIFPMSMTKGQNYSSFVEENGAGRLVWLVVLPCHMSHWQEKEQPVSLGWFPAIPARHGK